MPFNAKFFSIEVQKIQVGGRILAVLLNNRSIKIFGPLLAIGLMMVAVMAACSSDPETIVETREVIKEVEVEKVVEKVVEVTPTPVATGYTEVPRSETMIMAGLGGEHPGAFTDIEMFNAHAGGISRSGLYQNTEGLWYYNMLTGELMPWLALSFEYDDGYMGITVKLRDGVEWSDGTKFTSADVAGTLNMLNTNDKMSRHGDVNACVKEASEVDELTVHVEFSKTCPRFQWDVLTFRADTGVPMTPHHIFSVQDDPSTFAHYDLAKGWPVVTGPFKLVHSDVEKKIWDRRDDWWGSKTGFHDAPKVKRLIFLPGMNEITMAQMLIANEIDMAFSLTVPNYKAVKAQNDKMTSHHYGEPPYGYLDWWPVGLGLNTMRAPFDEVDVRWALSYAINRDEVIEFGFAGGQVVQELPLPKYKPMMKYFEGAKDLLEQYPTLEYNPEKSAALMEKSGFTKDSEGFWERDGERLTFTIVTFPQHPSTTPAAPVVTQNLRRNGFDATFVLPTDFVSRIISGEADAFIWGHAAMRDPLQTFDAYNCKYKRESDLEDATYPGLYRWCNEDYSALMDQIQDLPVDAPGVLPLFIEALEIWLKELPDITLNSTIITLPMNETYWTNWPQVDNQYIHEGFWHRTGYHIFLNIEPVN